MKFNHPVRTLPLLLLLGAMFLIGCQTVPKVNTETRAGADFSRYRTFFLMPLPERGPASDPGLMLRIATPARQAVVEALSAKGYQESPANKADFAVHLHGQSVPKVDVEQMGYARNVITRYGSVTVVEDPYVTMREYEARTLRIEVFDTRSKEVVWMGWSTRETQEQVRVKNVTNAIHHILAAFPTAGTNPIVAPKP